MDALDSSRIFLQHRNQGNVRWTYSDLREVRESKIPSGSSVRLLSPRSLLLLDVLRGCRGVGTRRARMIGTTVMHVLEGYAVSLLVVCIPGR